MITNQLKRQNEEVAKMRETLDAKNVSEYKVQSQLREAQRKHGELESRMKEDIMMARIRDAENTQCMAELTQKISSLEFKVILKKLLSLHLLRKIKMSPFSLAKLETQPTLQTLMWGPHGQNKRKSGYGFWPQVLSSSYSLYLSLSFCSSMIYPDYSCADHNCYPTPSFHSLPTTKDIHIECSIASLLI